jgi:hypothetical protein
MRAMTREAASAGLQGFWKAGFLFTTTAAGSIVVDKKATRTVGERPPSRIHMLLCVVVGALLMLTAQNW